MSKRKKCSNCNLTVCLYPWLCEMVIAGQPPASYGKGTWPMKSQAMACHPEQIQEMMTRNAQHGITGVSYDATGDAIISSPREKAKLMKLEGLRDRNGGYGDTYEGKSSIGLHEPPPPKKRPKIKGNYTFERNK